MMGGEIQGYMETYDLSKSLRRPVDALAKMYALDVSFTRSYVNDFKEDPDMIVGAYTFLKPQMKMLKMMRS